MREPTTLSTPCREWQGYRMPSGYGQRSAIATSNGRSTVLVHRWVVAQIDGWEALDGKYVIHLCDNPPCFRYDHLRIATPAENTADMMAKGRFVLSARANALKTHCKSGHAFDEANTYWRGDGWRACRTCGREASQRGRDRRAS